MSDDNDLAGTFTFSKVANPKSVLKKIYAKECVACYYGSKCRAGLKNNVNFDKKNFEISFLHLLIPSNSFTWPRVPYISVMCKIRLSITLTGQTYLEKESYEMISKLPN